MRMRVASRPVNMNSKISNSRIIGLQMLAPSQAAVLSNKLNYTSNRGFFWGGKSEETVQDVKVKETQAIDDTTPADKIEGILFF